MRRMFSIMLAGAILVSLIGLVSGCGVKGPPRQPQEPIIKGP
ncbi:MAG: hypothetical protein O2807_10560 [bacterium]|nr:hypothetical protein [bacterium]